MWISSDFRRENSSEELNLPLKAPLNRPTAFVFSACSEARFDARYSRKSSTSTAKLSGRAATFDWSFSKVVIAKDLADYPWLSRWITRRQNLACGIADPGRSEQERDDLCLPFVALGAK